MEQYYGNTVQWYVVTTTPYSWSSVLSGILFLPTYEGEGEEGDFDKLGVPGDKAQGLYGEI